MTSVPAVKMGFNNYNCNKLMKTANFFVLTFIVVFIFQSSEFRGWGKVNY